MRALLLSFALALGLLDCAPHQGRLLVVVETDLGPLRIRRVDVVVRRPPDAGNTHTFDGPAFPFSLVVSAGGRADPVEIVVSGYGLDVTPCVAPGEPVGCGYPVVSRTVVSPFHPGTTRLVRIRLTAACRGVECEEGRTCDEAGTCEPIPTLLIDNLPIVTTPGSELPLPTADRELDPIIALESVPTAMFGGAVALSDDGQRVVVGAPLDARGGVTSGTVWMLARTGEMFGDAVPLAPPSALAGAELGYAVALGGAGVDCRVLVGAPGQPDGAGVVTGRAFAFRCSDGGLDAELAEPSGTAGARFASALAIDGTASSAVVGAPGAAGVFRFTRLPIWSSPGRVTADGEELGAAVTITRDGTRALLGAPGRDVPTPDAGGLFEYEVGGPVSSVTPPGVMGTRYGASVAISDDGARAVIGWLGAAWILSRATGSWVADRELQLTDAATDVSWVVSIDGAGDRVWVAAPGDLDIHGVAGLFVRSGAGWTSRTTFQSDMLGDRFGTSVAISGDGLTAIVGAPGANRVHVYALVP